MYGYENDDFVEGEVNWSLIPSARSSQTVRRHEKSVDFDAIEENLQQSTSHLNREHTRNGLDLPVGVCSKVLARTEQRCHEKPTTSVPLKGYLPHPSKLKKRKQRHYKNTCSTSRSHYGFDVTAHVAQLKRKQAEFNWLPTILGNDVTSSPCSVDEEPICPPNSIGQAQCVPSTPTLVNESFKLQSENILESWQLPTLNNSGSSRAAVDLFNTFHQPPQLSGHYSIPSYAVARREIPQEELQDEQIHINLHSLRPDFDNFSSRIEQPNLTAWLNQKHPPFSPGNLFFPIARPLKEE